MDTLSLIDARPILPIAETSLWNRAAKSRDQLAADIESAMALNGLQAWVRKSKPGEYPFCVLVETWKPISSTSATQTTERSSLRITVSVEPFLEHPIIYNAILKKHHKTYEASYWDLAPNELTEMIVYLIHGGPKPVFFKSRTNFAAELLLSFIPFSSEEKNELIKEARPNKFTIPTLLGWLGILAIVYSVWIGYQITDSYSSEVSAPNYYLVGAIGIAAVICSAVLVKRRPRLQAVAKQPSRSPRKEYIVDSWQICVPNAGNENFYSFRRRLHDALRQFGSEVEYNLEFHQFFTPRGFEERERLVLTKGQGNLHVHIHPFGTGAFVGWDSYLNWARWGETKPVSSTVRNRKLIEYCSIAVSPHIPSEIDLMELNALAETAHRTLVGEIKSFLKEKEIEADLDFKIIRGDRSKALTAGREDTPKGKEKA